MSEIILTAPEANGAFILTVILRTQAQQLAALDAVAAMLDGLEEVKA